MQTHKKKIALSPSTGKPLNIELRAKRAVVREGQKVHSHKQRQKHRGCTPHVALLIFFCLEPQETINTQFTFSFNTCFNRKTESKHSYKKRNNTEKH